MKFKRKQLIIFLYNLLSEILQLIIFNNKLHSAQTNQINNPQKQTRQDQTGNMIALKQIIMLGIFFLLLVTTYSSFSFIITYMYQQKSKQQQNKMAILKFMGPILLFANYLCFLVTNSFAPGIRLSMKKQMLIAAFCYSFNYLMEMLQLPGYWGIALSILGALIGGYGAALLWVCYGAYAKTLCKMHGEQRIQGKYFSVLNGITFGSIVLGGVVTTYCIGKFQDWIYFLILTCIGAISFIFCFIFIKDIGGRGVYKGEHHWWTQLKRSFLFYKKMKAILPTLIYDGLVLGFISTSSTNLMPQKSEKTQIGLFLIILGIGCIIGGFTSGRLSDYFQMKNTGKFSILTIALTALFTVLVQPFSTKLVAYILALFWGFSRQFIEGWLYVACSRNYRGRLESYANMKQLHSFSFCIYQIIIIATQLEIETIYLMAIFIVLAPLCFWFLGDLPEIDQNQSKQLASNNNQNYDKNAIRKNQNGDNVTISLQSSSSDDF